MNHLTVSSLPLKDVIADLAKEMNTGFTENCKVFELKIPKSLGKGKIVGIDFDGGLGLIAYDCSFTEDTMIDFSVDKIHPVKFLICQEGEFEHSFKNETIWHDIRQFKNAIVASSANHGHLLKFKANTYIKLNSLELDRRKFQSRINCELDSLARPLQSMFNDVTAKKTFYHDGYYSLLFTEILKEWNRFDKNRFVRKIHLEGLSHRILALQIMQFEDDVRSEGKKTMLRQSELKQFKRALEIIDTQLDSLPTVTQIADMVGLQPKKLQQGFREIFGQSANDYIKQKRLKIIRTMLSNSNYSLSAIAIMVGLRSKSYLSQIFKQEFGIQPSKFRQNIPRVKVSPSSLLPKKVKD